MIYNEPPHDLEIETTIETCPYHKKHPFDTSYAGCSCFASWTARFKVDYNMDCTQEVTYELEGI